MTPFSVIMTHGSHGTLCISAYIDGVRVKREYPDGWNRKAALADFVTKADLYVYGRQ